MDSISKEGKITLNNTFFNWDLLKELAELNKNTKDSDINIRGCLRMKTKHYLLYSGNRGNVDALFGALKIEFKNDIKRIVDENFKKEIYIEQNGIMYVYTWYRDLRDRHFKTGEFEAVYIDECFYNTKYYFNLINMNDWATPESICSDIRFF